MNSSWNRSFKNFRFLSIDRALRFLYVLFFLAILIRLIDFPVEENQSEVGKILSSEKYYNSTLRYNLAANWARVRELKKIDTTVQFSNGEIITYKSSELVPVGSYVKCFRYHWFITRLPLYECN